MSYQFYSFLHILAVITAFISLTCIAFHIYSGGTKNNLKEKKMLSIIHGTSLLIAFVAGFGLIAKGGFSFSSSYWIYIKIACWLLIGIYPILLYKKILAKNWAIYGLMLIAAVAVYTVVFKPI
jgi:uncharacterized membrane protein SirB2